VLVVDNDGPILAGLGALLRSAGHEVVLAQSAKEALALLQGVEAVVADYAMPEMNGVELIQAIRQRDETLPAILLTAHGSETVEARAVKAGAYQYVAKPVDSENLLLVVERALEAHTLRLENRRLAVEKLLGRSIIADSAPMRQLLHQVQTIGPRDITVLVRGETGTGKELITSLLHVHSRRAAGPLVRFNCAAVPKELAEAELFGHCRGAFTGAHQSRPGFFAQADGGTLVLDEIGELPLNLQAVLLRALQEGEIQPVGAGRVERVDVRVIACTNRDLAADARAGRFRQDLYFRLAVVDLVVPPLRQRRDDIPALVHEFARIYTERFGRPEFQLSAADLEELAAAEWPGNVRQLENAVARIVALGERPHLSPVSTATPGIAPPPPPSTLGQSGTDALTLREQVEALERGVITRTLAQVGGNQSETARRLGLSRGALIDRLRKYGLLRGSPRPEECLKDS
ncbi:MAG TPA: sigma-54 dependent transcriptional regulator, partial [Myxococcaceae bacterium]|nr:sigma-54 dependent transcriptional regulator [Myxococcaceae bacterium]